jgi:hypothetical protein
VSLFQKTRKFFIALALVFASSTVWSAVNETQINTSNLSINYVRLEPGATPVL